MFYTVYVLYLSKKDSIYLKHVKKKNQKRIVFSCIFINSSVRYIAFAILCGIIFGPVCAKFINVSDWGDEDTITKEFCRIVIGIQVMAAGVALPKAYLRKELISLLMLLGPVMIYMWLVSGLLVWALIPGLNYVRVFHPPLFFYICLYVFCLA